MPTEEETEKFGLAGLFCMPRRFDKDLENEADESSMDNNVSEIRFLISKMDTFNENQERLMNDFKDFKVYVECMFAKVNDGIQSISKTYGSDNTKVNNLVF